MCNGTVGVAELAGGGKPPEAKASRRKENGKGKKAAAGTQEPRLVGYDELPEYMKENEFIRDYYRAEWPLQKALLSLFGWHNETLNVWTHLVGFLVFVWLTAANLRHVSKVARIFHSFSWSMSIRAAENASLNQANFFSEALNMGQFGSRRLAAAAAAAETRWPFFVFLAGAMFCLLTSSLCHLFCCHSRRLNIFLSRLDYVGIAVMIVSSFFPPIYYVFRCDPHWQILYLAAISAMGALTVATLFSPHLTTGAFRAFRAILFAGMGLSGIVPAVHGLVVNWDDPQRPATMAWEAAMAGFYLAGTLFYVSRVPERWGPGRFDLTGHSHQIFHLFVIAGALAHYKAAVILLDGRGAAGCA